MQSFGSKRIEAVLAVALLTIALAGTLTACAATSPAVSKVDDIARVVVAQGPEVIVDISNLTAPLSGHLDDLKLIPQPTAAEAAAIRAAQDLLAYRQMVDAASQLGDEAVKQIPTSAAKIASQGLTVRTVDERFRRHLEDVLARMIKSTTCSMVHELMTTDEEEWVEKFEPSYESSGSTRFREDATEFFWAQMGDAGWDLSAVGKIFPVLDAIKRVDDVSKHLLEDLETISEAHNAATTRAFVYYYRVCVLK